jgi:hypothetical protein
MKHARLAFWFFFAIFGAVLLFGLYLTHISVLEIKNADDSMLVVEWGKDKFTFKLITGIPGLILVAMGILAELTLLVKVPVLLKVPAVAPGPSVLSTKGPPLGPPGLAPGSKPGAMPQSGAGISGVPPLSSPLPATTGYRTVSKKVPLLFYWIYSKGDLG